MNDKRSSTLKIVALAQARMGATRLPNKMMLCLHNRPIVEWVLRRTSKSQKLDAIVFAIPDTPNDDILALYLERLGALVFRGSENDVLSRFYKAAEKFQASHVVRICCDNPLISPVEIDNLIAFYFQHPCDYAYNHRPLGNRYPDGLGAEIISFQLLKHLNEVAQQPSHREHAFNYIWDNQDQFVLATFDPPNTLLAQPDVKLDIDTMQDYFRLSKAHISPEMQDIIILEALGAVTHENT